MIPLRKPVLLSADRRSFRARRARAQPELTLERIRSLAESDPKGRRLIELLFVDRPDDMDEATLRFLLRMLEQELHERLDEAVTGEPSWLSHSLELLGGLTHPDFWQSWRLRPGVNWSE